MMNLLLGGYHCADCLEVKAHWVTQVGHSPVLLPAAMHLKTITSGPNTTSLDQPAQLWQATKNKSPASTI